MFHARCIAFEATPDTAALCRDLKQANGLNFEVINSAVTSVDGIAMLYLSTKAETSNSLNPDFRPGGEPVSVPAVTIDSFAANGPDPTILKIDTETHDPDVILGAIATIKRARPVILCELLNKTDRAKAAEAIGRVLNLGYFAFNLHSPTPPTGYHADAVVAAIDSAIPGWALLPAPPDAKFSNALKTWTEALRQCGQATNVITDAGSRPPYVLSPTRCVRNI